MANLTQAQLDARLIENFAAGVRRCTKTYEQYAKDNDEKTQELIDEGWVPTQEETLLQGLAELAGESMAAAVRIEFVGWPPTAWSRTGSPLERALLLAFHAYAPHVCWRGTVVNAHCDDKGHHERAPEDLVQAGVPFISICTQHRLSPYSADFLVTGYMSGRSRRVVVEVDGHDFHERTKDQASSDKKRDRSMQLQGFTVFRFTGADVFADPIACAKEAVDAALALS